MLNKPVHAPNLPVQCSMVLMGEDYRALFSDALSVYDIETVSVPRNDNLTASIQSHCDLSILHIGNNRILCDSAIIHKICNREELQHISWLPIPEHSSCQYPGDCLLNACIIGEKVILNPKTVSTSALSYLQQNGYTIIPIKQGYANCSVCVVNDYAIITEDPGISKTATSNGFDVLLIRPGSVQLPGFPYGFIGGATFKISESRLCFTGCLDCLSTTDRNSIRMFLDKYDVEPIELRNGPILDIGGAVPIFEK